MDKICLSCGTDSVSRDRICKIIDGTMIGVCQTCLDNAKLGRMVRGMPIPSWLARDDYGWLFEEHHGSTPLEALEAAGVKS